MAHGIAVAVSAAALLLGLSLHLLRRHRDRKAAAIAFAGAGMVVALWILGASERKLLESELSLARERLAGDETAERSFTPERRELLVRRLRDFVGPTAFVVANASDPETAGYARQIVAILKDAGWRVPPSFGMIYQPIVLPGHEGVEPGVVLGVTREVPRAFAASLVEVLRGGGIDVVEGPHWPGTEHPISLLVGPRREP